MSGLFSVSGDTLSLTDSPNYEVTGPLVTVTVKSVDAGGLEWSQVLNFGIDNVCGGEGALREGVFALFSPSPIIFCLWVFIGKRGSPRHFVFAIHQPVARELGHKHNCWCCVGR